MWSRSWKPRSDDGFEFAIGNMTTRNGSATGYSYAGSNLGGRTALAMVLGGYAAWTAYGSADAAAQSHCESHCGP